ncbi:type 1 glutamine amidotransferase [Acinetobacter sp. ANC 5383]
MKSGLKVHYFQHIAGEGFGSCYDFLKAHQAKITATEFFALPGDTLLEIEALPQIEDVDLLIIMGGEMSVNDEVNYPWLRLEKRWIRRYLATGKPAIGLCLGGQLIANALGAAVNRHVHKELGWATVYRIDNVPKHCFELPKEFNVLQWHSETFDLPKGAIHLAENSACRNQMYQISHNILGFQFHPEMTPEILQKFLDDDDKIAIFDGEQIQHIDHLKKSPLHYFLQGNDLLNRAIEFVLKTA